MSWIVAKSMASKNVMGNVVVSCLSLLILGNFNAIVTYGSVAYKKHDIKIPIEWKNDSLSKKEHGKRVSYIAFYPEILSLCIYLCSTGWEKVNLTYSEEADVFMHEIRRCLRLLSSYILTIKGLTNDAQQV